MIRIQTLQKLIKWIKVYSTAKGSKDLIDHYGNGDDKWVQDLVNLLIGNGFGLYSKIWWKLEGENGSLHIFQKGANIGFEQVKPKSNSCDDGNYRKYHPYKCY